jgi:hypothetical protein
VIESHSHRIIRRVRGAEHQPGREQRQEDLAQVLPARVGAALAGEPDQDAAMVVVEDLRELVAGVGQDEPEPTFGRMCSLRAYTDNFIYRCTQPIHARK